MERAPHILVINDEEEILNLFRDLLSGEGYRVSTLTFPAADLDDLHRLAPDALVLDLLIGGENRGWQYLQQVRMDRVAAAIPILVCSAAVRVVQEVLPHLEEMGVKVLTKPFDIDELLGAVRSLLAGRGGALPEDG